MNQNLRQCFNSLTVVGTLKSKEVKFGTTANGDSTISLDLVVVSNDVDKVHENKIRLCQRSSMEGVDCKIKIARTVEMLG